MADESKNEYAAQLQNFNAEQWKHFNNAIPHIFKVMQTAAWREFIVLIRTQVFEHFLFFATGMTDEVASNFYCDAEKQNETKWLCLILCCLLSQMGKEHQQHRNFHLLPSESETNLVEQEFNSVFFPSVSLVF